MSENTEAQTGRATNFIRNIIEEDLEQGVNLPRYWRGRPGPYSEQLAEGSPDLARIRTRFPPEPNGYLHIGHAKSICLNFGLARDYGGRCHMRFDDTNPVKEDQEYVDGILDSVRWLGFTWEHAEERNLYFASMYFEYMYAFAEHLIKTGYAYVDEQTADEMRDSRGTLTEPGKNSPYRDRPVEESMRLFREMRAGKHAEGSMVLRARIDMASPNMNLRDPAIYRIRFAEHHATGNKWCIYPMYTFAHPVEDALENITHSICTLEFEDQRAFYNWALERIIPVLRTPQYEEAKGVVAELAAGTHPKTAEFIAAMPAAAGKLGQSAPEAAVAAILAKWTEGEPAADEVKAVFAEIAAHMENFTPFLQDALSVVRKNFFLLPHQYEFNRLSLTYVVVSKRKLIQLVNEKRVDGWDDPRMPTIVGLRRRGYTPESLQLFAERCGVSKVSGGWIDYAILEQSLREDLEARAQRRSAVLHPLKLIIDNYPEGQSETLMAENHPQKPEMGMREISFSRELWIEESDFAEVPPKGFRRLTVPADGSPAKPVRLRYGYVIVPTSFEKDETGRVTAVHANYLPETKSGTEGSVLVKTKATIHWLDAATAKPAEIRVYDRLFNVPNPEAGEGSFLDRLTPNSKVILSSYVEPCVAACAPDEKYQFERNGYFVADRKDHSAEHPVFNLSVGLRDSWGK
ncbi:glutamine--tRNA ligase [Sutterella sp.]|uniref:glutamine--tRNA ligase n=1 Tax=Sutterella sp. TaxID=1981025 RepID=UPI0026DF7388|nr:glutamine--tRNA ligase [Sutterella sp.]MDO5531922.1 glutamine--tRNA ligase [Sutterella sp.]